MLDFIDSACYNVPRITKKIIKTRKLDYTMSYKIVVDSPCDYTPEMKKWTNIAAAPLSLQVGDYTTLDDENFDQEDFVKRMRAYPEAAKSACPSIESWIKAFEGDEDELYVITITANLSGTYNSAMQAAAIYKEEVNANKKIHVFNSNATSGKETIIALKVRELAESGMAFEKVVTEITKFIDRSSLYFCFDDFENLRKNGRMSNLQSTVLNALRVKLILKETDGVIDKLTQDISINRAVNKLTDIVIKELAGSDTKNNTLIVNHCMCPERGKQVFDKITKAYKFKEAHLMGMGGLNTLYTNEGGILISFSK